MEYRADFTAVPESLQAEVPQRRTWVHWLVVLVSVPLIALYLPSLVLTLVVWSQGVSDSTGGAETFTWFILLPVLLILFILQCGAPLAGLWFALPHGFGLDHVTVHNDVLEGRMAFRRIKLLPRRFDLRRHSGAEVSVDMDRKGRPHIRVRADRAMPFLIDGEMDLAQATELAEAIRSCAGSDEADPDTRQATNRPGLTQVST